MKGKPGLLFSVFLESSAAQVILLLALCLALSAGESRSCGVVQLDIIIYACMYCLYSLPLDGFLLQKNIPFFSIQDFGPLLAFS